MQLQGAQNLRQGRGAQFGRSASTGGQGRQPQKIITVVHWHHLVVEDEYLPLYLLFSVHGLRPNEYIRHAIALGSRTMRDCTVIHPVTCSPVPLLAWLLAPGFCSLFTLTIAATSSGTVWISTTSVAP